MSNTFQTPKEDLNSKLGMNLKRAMLLRLARKNTELYPSDPIKRDKVYEKYKVCQILTDFKHLISLLSRCTIAGIANINMGFFFWLPLTEQQFEIPEEEAEWVGLSLEEAVEKQRLLEHKVTKFSKATV